MRRHQQIRPSDALNARLSLAVTGYLERVGHDSAYYSAVDSSTHNSDSAHAIPLATGRINYRELDDGSWIINDWTIRVPVIAFYTPRSPWQRGSGDNSDSTKSKPMPYVERLQEFGGDVTEVTMPRSNSRNP